MEILASLANSVVLILLSAYILYEGFTRLFDLPAIQGFPIVLAAAIGLVVNFIGMRSLISGGNRGHSHGLHNHTKQKEDEEHLNHKEEKEEQSLNIKAVYLETLSDTIGAAGVLVAGLIMTSTNFYLADPIISIGLALFILPRTWSIIKKAIHILMQGSPYNISCEEVQEAILKIRGVTGIFDLYI